MLGNDSAALPFVYVFVCKRRASESCGIRDLQVPSQIVLGKCHVLGVCQC